MSLSDPGLLVRSISPYNLDTTEIESSEYKGSVAIVDADKKCLLKVCNNSSLFRPCTTEFLGDRFHAMQIGKFFCTNRKCL